MFSILTGWILFSKKHGRKKAKSCYKAQDGEEDQEEQDNKTTIVKTAPMQIGAVL